MTLLTWDLVPSHFLPTLLLPTPTTPMLLSGTHEWAGYSPMGLAFGADRVVEDAKSTHWLVAFGRV
jgi:hypothetical protein